MNCLCHRNCKRMQSYIYVYKNIMILTVKLIYYFNCNVVGPNSLIPSYYLSATWNQSHTSKVDYYAWSMEYFCCTIALTLQHACSPLLPRRGMTAYYLSVAYTSTPSFVLS